MKRQIGFLDMPVVVRQWQLPLQTGTDRLTAPKMVLWCNGTLIEKRWGITQSLQGPQFGTYSNIIVWTKKRLYKPSLTLAEVLRGLTSQKTCKVSTYRLTKFIKHWSVENIKA